MASKLYDERAQKIKDTVNFKNESVTTCFMGQAAPAAHMGVKMKDFALNPDIMIKMTLDYINEINAITSVDCLNTGVNGMRSDHSLPMAWLSKVKMPGIELPDDSLWQVVETSIFKPEDYDVIIEQGFDTVFNRIFPQLVNMKEFQESIAYQEENGQKNVELFINNDFPSVNSGVASPPFEVLCGGRSMSQFFMDCYKIPDKIEKAIEVMLPGSIHSMLASVNPVSGSGAWVGGWRGASALVSPKIWNRLVWPGMKAMGLALIENNDIATFHLDQCWDRDIERFLEIPEKKSIINTDGMTDLRKARKILGEHVAIMGDVPAPLLATGTTQEVKDYVTKLIDDIGPKGLFVTAGCDAPANTKFENMVAMFQAANDWK
ncbi:uroporphyrinogen decarboxylase family protein [Acetobacterium tundrae]|uniref:Methyltransferase n=1 Tax=Acetobacterium tundrae TaxID=132932 RepID=A0ABR6WHD9_9FIRM|nr:uroporphyrinogen decarboxylase family protein [Acetobacterium tundrae]MBC3795871.1 methyltransferase [Acetobacterium tundrae]